MEGRIARIRSVLMLKKVSGSGPGAESCLDDEDQVKDQVGEQVARCSGSALEILGKSPLLARLLLAVRLRDGNHQ
jgi:hypothetical protein